MQEQGGEGVDGAPAEGQSKVAALPESATQAVAGAGIQPDVQVVAPDAEAVMPIAKTELQVTPAAVKASVPQVGEKRPHESDDE